MMNFMKKKERFFDLCYGFLWMAVCRNSYLMQHHYNYYTTVSYTSGTRHHILHCEKCKAVHNENIF